MLEHLRIVGRIQAFPCIPKRTSGIPRGSIGKKSDAFGPKKAVSPYARRNYRYPKEIGRSLPLVSGFVRRQNY